MPSLDEIADNPSGVASLPPQLARMLTLRCAVVLAALAGVEPPAESVPEGVATEDRLLDVREAAQRLGTSADYLYRHGRTLPFTVRVGSRLRFSSRGIDRYIRVRQGR